MGVSAASQAAMEQAETIGNEVVKGIRVSVKGFEDGEEHRVYEQGSRRDESMRHCACDALPKVGYRFRVVLHGWDIVRRRQQSWNFVAERGWSRVTQCLVPRPE